MSERLCDFCEARPDPRGDGVWHQSECPAVNPDVDFPIVDPETLESDEGQVYTYAGGYKGEVLPLLVMSDAARELMRVTSDNEVVMPDDLTLDEAKDVIRQLAPHALIRSQP